MGAVLIYILAVVFLVLPATVIYALVLLVMGLSDGNLGAHFTLIPVRILGAAGVAILLAAILFIAFGKQLVVK